MNDAGIDTRRMIPGVEDVTVSAPPGMLFWDRHGEAAYFPFLADGPLDGARGVSPVNRSG